MRKFYRIGILLLSINFATTAAEKANDTSTLAHSNLDFYAKPHKLVELPGGRKINLVCVGNGSPTILLFIGLRGWSEDWYKVQKPISHSKYVRVCAWDRPGFGFSDPSPLPQEIHNTTKDFITALKEANINGPYIMVAHSMGALEALTYADWHPRQVAGMVFVDPSSPGGMERMKRLAPKFYTENNKANLISAMELKQCADKLKEGDQNPVDCATFRPIHLDKLKKAQEKMDSDPLRYMTRISLEEKLENSFELAINPQRNYRNIPIRVLSAGDSPTFPPPFDPEAAKEFPVFFSDWHLEQEKLAKLSSRGKFSVVTGSGHNMQEDKPGAIISAVGEVVDEVRGTGK